MTVITILGHQNLSEWMPIWVDIRAFVSLLTFRIIQDHPLLLIRYVFVLLNELQEFVQQLVLVVLVLVRTALNELVLEHLAG